MECQKQFNLLIATSNDIYRWWRSLGLAEDLKLLRDQPLKWYAWPMAMITDPIISQQRIEIAKCFSFIYVIDDIGWPSSLKLSIGTLLEKTTLFSSCQ